MAFGITPEDLDFVLSKFENTSHITNEKREDIFSDLNMNAIEKAALWEISMDDQVSAAYSEIESQLRDMNIL